MDDAQLAQRVIDFVSADEELLDQLMEREPKSHPPDINELMYWLELEAPQQTRESIYRQALNSHTSALRVFWQRFRFLTNIKECGVEDMVRELADITNTN